MKGLAWKSNWILTGFSLPSGDIFLIRARGYYGTGGFNGSESMVESVSNVFFAGDAPAPPTPLSSPPPTPTATATATPTLTATPTCTPTPTFSPSPSSTPLPPPIPEPPKPIDPNNILVSVPFGFAAVGPPLNVLKEFTPGGTLVQTIPFNYNGATYPGTENLRDIVVGPDQLFPVSTVLSRRFSSLAFRPTQEPLPIGHFQVGAQRLS